MKNFKLTSGELAPKSLSHPSISRPASHDPSMLMCNTEEQLGDSRQPIEPGVVLSNLASGTYEALNTSPQDRNRERKQMKKLLRNTCQPTTMVDIFDSINQRINDSIANIVLGSPAKRFPEMTFRVATTRNFEHENSAENRIYKRHSQDIGNKELPFLLQTIQDNCEYYELNENSLRAITLGKLEMPLKLLFQGYLRRNNYTEAANKLLATTQPQKEDALTQWDNFRFSKNNLMHDALQLQQIGLEAHPGKTAEEIDEIIIELLIKSLDKEQKTIATQLRARHRRLHKEGFISRSLKLEEVLHAVDKGTQSQRTFSKSLGAELPKVPIYDIPRNSDHLSNSLRYEEELQKMRIKNLENNIFELKEAMVQDKINQAHEWQTKRTWHDNPGRASQDNHLN